MKRRKAVAGISLLVAGVVSYSGFRWFKLNSTPDFDELVQNKQLIASLADTIIPKTSLPSASECQVADFIIKMVMENTDSRTQNNFIAGLADLQAQAQSSYGKSFVTCSLSEQKELMLYIADKGKVQPGIIGKVKKRILGKSFFNVLREYTAIGYCTSELGATTALKYSLVPSNYISCQPYQPGEKAWATY
jgi:hypothetical protein